MIAKTTDSLRGAAQTLRADGPTALWARMRLREQAEYQDWLEERDIVMVIAALRRLSERQLERIGMSHRTLALDIDDLAKRARREREIGNDVLELVEERNDRMMAAE
jgi:hypothetical protein